MPRGLARGLIPALLALVLAASPPTTAAPAATAERVGVEMPAAGDDGALGLAVLTAVRLGLGRERVVARDSANGGFLNPHRDEGSDNDVDRRTAPSIIASFASDRTVVAAVGGLRRNVGDADAAAAEARGLPAIVLSRWSRAPGGANAFCLCVSPPRLVAFARGVARARFGPRLLVVLVGDAGTLPAVWPGGFDGTRIVRAGDAGAAVGAVRRRAPDADAVLMIADERPAALWQSAVFARRFDREYVRRLGHRDFAIVPEGTPPGAIVLLREALPDGPARRAFARRFHAAAGYLPGADVIRAYAAAQILREAGTDRASVRRALRMRRFDTVAGPVVFDGDGYRRNGVLTAAAP